MSSKNKPTNKSIDENKIDKSLKKNTNLPVSKKTKPDSSKKSKTYEKCSQSRSKQNSKHKHKHKHSKHYKSGSKKKEKKDKSISKKSKTDNSVKPPTKPKITAQPINEDKSKASDKSETEDTKDFQGKIVDDFIDVQSTKKETKKPEIKEQYKSITQKTKPKNGPVEEEKSKVPESEKDASEKNANIIGNDNSEEPKSSKENKKQEEQKKEKTEAKFVKLFKKPEPQTKNEKSKSSKKPEPKTETKSEPKAEPEAKSDKSKSTKQSEPKSDDDDEPKIETKDEAQTTSEKSKSSKKPVPNSESKDEPKIETKAEPQTTNEKSKSSKKPAPNNEPKAEPKIETKAEPKIDPKVEPKTDDDENDYVEDESDKQLLVEESKTASSSTEEEIMDNFEMDDSSTNVEKSVLESTKPTINQQVKMKKERPICMEERIGKQEFEALNDEINELNSGVKTLKHSYGSIIKSLMMMQNRREKKKLARQKEQQPKMNLLTTISTLEPKEMNEMMLIHKESNADKYCMENFINPLTREDTFQMLFQEIEELNKQTERLRSTCFDRRGNFLRDKYEQKEQADCRLSRKKFNELKLTTKKALSVINELARNYNDDLLNMFRLV